MVVLVVVVVVFKLVVKVVAKPLLRLLGRKPPQPPPGLPTPSPGPPRHTAVWLVLSWLVVFISNHQKLLEIIMNFYYTLLDA